MIVRIFQIHNFFLILAVALKTKRSINVVRLSKKIWFEILKREN